MNKFEFVGRCDALKADDLYDYENSERMISYQTFVRKVGIKQLKILFGHIYNFGKSKKNGLKLKDDFHVTYSKGKWKGKNAVCVYQSAWHHIFVSKGD